MTDITARLRAGSVTNGDAEKQRRATWATIQIAANGTKSLSQSGAQSVFGLLQALTIENAQLRSNDIEAAEEIERLRALVFVPGMQRCAKCGFVHTHMILDAQSGAVGSGETTPSSCPNGCGPLWPVTERQSGDELAERLEALIPESNRVRETLEWYGEQSRLSRLIHSEGDQGRHALADDGGKRARAALAPKETDGD